MKKIRILTAVSAIAIALGLVRSSGLFAQEKPSQEKNRQMVQEHTPTRTQMNESGTLVRRDIHFIDEDGNGICDRFEMGLDRQQNKEHGMGHGGNFIDENGDGICDYRGSGSMNNGRKHGNGWNEHGSMSRGRH